MNTVKQVDKSHYDFANYITKERWNSLWEQLNEVHKLNPEGVLEIGPGPGLFKVICSVIGIRVETLDIDPDLEPDHIGSVIEIPLPDASYDVVCAFQMLEHLPYDKSLLAFKEMARVSRRKVIISLPDAQKVWRNRLHFPKMRIVDMLISLPRFRLKIHEFDGEHYWEINKRNYPLSKVVHDFSKIIRLEKTYRVTENPYHRFFIFSL